MGFAQLSQWMVLLMVAAGLVALWVRNLRPPKDDPRLSKGLQLLQSKIAVLEDLADRTDTQVQQLNLLIEKKSKELQEKMLDVDRCIQKIDVSLGKSKEMAKLFEDRIPHKEILERQNTAKYVKAARLANQGYSVQEICRQVNISPAEVEFIAKVNKNQLMFSEEELPEWAQEAPKHEETVLDEVEWIENNSSGFNLTAQEQPLGSANMMSADKKEALRQIGEKFQQEIAKPVEAALPSKSKAAITASAVKSAAAAQDQVESITMTNGKTATIRPMQFKKIDLDRNLG